MAHNSSLEIAHWSIFKWGVSRSSWRIFRKLQPSVRVLILSTQRNLRGRDLIFFTQRISEGGGATETFLAAIRLLNIDHWSIFKQRMSCLSILALYFFLNIAKKKPIAVVFCETYSPNLFFFWDRRINVI